MKAIFLDAGGVITRLKASKPVVFREASASRGLDLSMRRVQAAFESADTLLKQGQQMMLSDYPRFKARYMEILRSETGLGDELEAVYGEYMQLLQSPRFRSLYEDAPPALQALRDRGLLLGVLSNASQELIPLLLRMGVAYFFDTLVISQLVGYEKPQTEIFRVALESLEVRPEEAFHVGDSYYYDYLGASNAGLKAVLLDRDGSCNDQVPKIGSLQELPSLPDL